MKTNNENIPAIYVSTYRKYNNGSLFGKWVNITDFDNYDDFVNFCRQLHNDEPDPEFMVQDFEEFPRSLYHESGLPTEDEFQRIKEYAELDSDERQAYQMYLDNVNSQAELDEFRDHYDGYFRNVEDFAEYICDECGYLEQIPNFLRDCIDFGAVWRTLETGGDFYEYDGHIFH